MPLVERVHKVNLGEQIQSVTSRLVIADGTQVSVQTMIRYQIVDPVAATYHIANLRSALEELTTSTLRALLGILDLNQLRGGHHDQSNQLRSTLAQAIGPWGVQIHELRIQAIEPVGRR